VSVSNRVRWARFDAVTAENAARVIDVVNAGVAFACGDAAGVGIFRGLDVDAIGRASRCAEKTSNALLESGFVAVQHVNSAITRLKMHRFEGIVLRNIFRNVTLNPCTSVLNVSPTSLKMDAIG